MGTRTGLAILVVGAVLQWWAPLFGVPLMVLGAVVLALAFEDDLLALETEDADVPTRSNVVRLADRRRTDDGRADSAA